MKFFTANIHFFDNPEICEELKLMKDVDVYCFQEVNWSAASTPMDGFECTIRYKTQSTQVHLNFTDQQTLHDSVCRALGFPISFEFQIKDDKGFVFYPNKKNPQPRAYQNNLILGSFMTPIECWVKPNQFVENTYCQKLANNLNTPYCYFCGTQNPSFGNMILSKHKFVDIQFEMLKGKLNLEWSTRNAQFVQLDLKTPMYVINTHLDHRFEDERLTQLAQLFKKFPAEHHTVLCGDFNSLRKEDYTQQQIESFNVIREENKLEKCKFDVINIVGEKMFDSAWFGPRGSVCGCVEPTTRYGTRVDYIFTSADLKSGIVKENVVVLDKSDHNGVLVEVHLGAVVELQE
ncbi:Endonuclease/Exonuclease/phosphatase_family [Hexamita inflata]|uniref:Endonuclease/Exonuclease/phosphatase_family n=1 Tax=Hexamita inflata TaxID=28002 RepID=A0ABP1L180_9EUKA